MCGEAELPYDRPPLSKEMLAGELKESEVGFRPAGWYADQGVELIFRRAMRLDAKRRQVRLDDGPELGYEDLVIATGGAPGACLSWSGYSNVHYLRTIADARRLRRELREGARLVVIGAGFIGQEVACTASAAGADVTIVEAPPTPLAAVLGEEIGRSLMRMHSDQGIDVRLSTKLEGARGNGTVEELVLSGGGKLACDAVVVGIGVAPDSGWLRDEPPGEGRRAYRRGRADSRFPMCSRRATSPSPSTTMSAGIVAASTGTLPSARESPQRGRCWGSGLSPLRRRASGATSTACGSSTSAMPISPTR